MKFNFGKYSLRFWYSTVCDKRFVELRNTQWRCGIDSWHVKRWSY
jgi:hypothetical protein